MEISHLSDSRFSCFSLFPTFLCLSMIDSFPTSPFGRIRRWDARDQRRKLVGAHAPALMKTHLFVLLAVGYRPVLHARSVFRFAAHVLKGQNHRHKRMFRRLP